MYFSIKWVYALVDGAETNSGKKDHSKCRAEWRKTDWLCN